jgi:hypothetical protein
MRAERSTVITVGRPLEEEEGGAKSAAEAFCDSRKAG